MIVWLLCYCKMLNGRVLLAWATHAATCLKPHASSFKRASLAWARWCLTQNESTLLERELERELGPVSASLA